MTQERLKHAIIDSNMKMSDKTELVEYITKLERKVFGLETQVQNLKEKEQKHYRDIR